MFYDIVRTKHRTSMVCKILAHAVWSFIVFIGCIWLIDVNNLASRDVVFLLYVSFLVLLFTAFAILTLADARAIANHLQLTRYDNVVNVLNDANILIVIPNNTQLSLIAHAVYRHLRSLKIVCHSLPPQHGIYYVVPDRDEFYAPRPDDVRDIRPEESRLTLWLAIGSWDSEFGITETQFDLMDNGHLSALVNDGYSPDYRIRHDSRPIQKIAQEIVATIFDRVHITLRAEAAPKKKRVGATTGC